MNSILTTEAAPKSIAFKSKHPNQSEFESDLFEQSGNGAIAAESGLAKAGFGVRSGAFRVKGRIIGAHVAHRRLLFHLIAHLR